MNYVHKQTQSWPKHQQQQQQHQQQGAVARDTLRLADWWLLAVGLLVLVLPPKVIKLWLACTHHQLRCVRAFLGKGAGCGSLRGLELGLGSFLEGGFECRDNLWPSMAYK